MNFIFSESYHMTDRYKEEKKIFFQDLSDQIDDGPEETKNDENNNKSSNKSTEGDESSDFDMYEFEDQIFKNEKSQFIQLKVKVVAEMLFQLRKKTKIHVPAQNLAEWLDEHAKDYNIKIMTSKEGGEEFELCRGIAGFRNRIDQFLKLRQTRGKSLLLINSHKKVDLDQLVYKTVAVKRDAKLEKEERQAEIDDIRNSNDYNEPPEIYPKNSLRGNKVKAKKSQNLSFLVCIELDFLLIFYVIQHQELY